MATTHAPGGDTPRRGWIRGLALLPFAWGPGALGAAPDAPWTGDARAFRGPDVTVTVPEDGSTGPAVLTYATDAAGSPSRRSRGALTRGDFVTVAAADRTVRLRWTLAGDHGVRLPFVVLRAFADDDDGPGPRRTLLAEFARSRGDGFAYTGEVRLDVTAGAPYGFEFVAATSDTPPRLEGTLTVDGVPSLLGDATLVQAVPSGPELLVAVRLAGAPGARGDVEILTGATCTEGRLGGSPAPVGVLESVVLDAAGDGFATGSVPLTGPLGPYVAARALDDGGVPGDTGRCVVAGPDNDAWTRALTIVPEGPGPRTVSATGFLDVAGGARWFRFPVTPAARAVVELSDLPADYDLAVFRDIAQAFEALVGDADVEGLNRLGAEFAPSVFSPSVFSPSVFSPSVFSPDAYAPSVFSPSVFSPSVFSPSVFSPSVFSPSVFSPSVFSPSVFSPDTFASAQTRSLVAVAATPGTGSERVVADIWNNTGFFYVRVNGRNGAADPSAPFRLTVTVDGDTCAGVVPRNGPVAAEAGAYRTLVLWDPDRMDPARPGNEPSAMAGLRERLEAYVDRPEVRGRIVDLGALPHVRALHDQADAADACPYAENLVARAAKGVVDAFRASNPELAYVVLVGNDAQVPFFRYPDQSLLGPEQDYEPPMANGTQAQAALRLNYVLGQDEYGASTVLDVRDGRIPLPQLAVGRLVESAREATRVLDAYLATPNGVVPTPTATLVTGYDFLTDAADAVHAELVAGTAGARNDLLVTAADVSPADPRSWSAEDLRRELLDEGEDLVYLAGHFSANSALAADYETVALATELAASPVDLENAIIFSAGCHSGYNIVDEERVVGVTEPVDWTQAFARKGATLIAGTGYQYGDTDFVEYGERLYAGFARELRRGTGPVAVGDALVRAKRSYLARTPDVRGLHRKTVLISTVFGLPNLRVDLPGERIAPEGTATAVSPAPVVEPPGAVLGLQTADLALDLAGTLAERTLTLDVLGGGSLDATWLEGPQGVSSHPAEPALPLATIDVSAPGLSLRGVGFRGGAWRERPVIPLTGAPTTELRGVHTPFTSPIDFPMRLATPGYFDALDGGGRTVLHVTPVQHRVAAVGDVLATQRRFDTLAYRLFYSADTRTFDGNRPALAGPPSFSGIRAFVDGEDVVFESRVVGDPAAGIQAVWVTWTDGGAPSGTWRSLDLAQDPADSTLWRARLAGVGSTLGRLDFIVQAANGAGLVAVDDAYGTYHGLESTGADPLPSTLALRAPPGEPFGGEVTVEATLTAQGLPVADRTVLFSLGATVRPARTDGTGLARSTLPVTLQPGPYAIEATFLGDDAVARTRARQPFTVLRARTGLTVERTPERVGIDGIDPGFAVLLASADGTPLLQRTVYFTLEDTPEGLRTIPVITDNLGRARLPVLPLPAGRYPVTARFLGRIPTADGEQAIDDPVYEPVAIEDELVLVGAPGCPTGVFEGPLALRGFCFLRGPVFGPVTITDGTLVVGADAGGFPATVRGTVRQLGAGGVRVLPGGRVERGVEERGPGRVEVRGQADGGLQEHDAGDLVLAPGATVTGRLDEAGAGTLRVEGVLDGSAAETGPGDLILAPAGSVTGDVDETGPGELLVDGVLLGSGSSAVRGAAEASAGDGAVP